MARLYELTEAYAALVAMLEDCETASEEEQLLSELTGLNDAIGDKAEAYARIMRNMLSDIEGCKAEIDRLKGLKERLENAVDRMKANLRYAMEIAGASEINTSIGKWRIHRNPPKVLIDDAALVPEKFLLPQPPKVDSKGILAAYRTDGELIPGTHIVQEESVRFK